MYQKIDIGLKRPNFKITNEQRSKFGTYGTEQDINETIIGRILSGDPSALNATPEQVDYANKLKSKINPSDFEVQQYIRKPYQGETDYFKKNINVAGMATEDGKIILNPYNTSANKNAVAKNEFYRLKMREMDRESSLNGLADFIKQRIPWINK